MQESIVLPTLRSSDAMRWHKHVLPNLARSLVKNTRCSHLLFSSLDDLRISISELSGLNPLKNSPSTDSSSVFNLLWFLVPVFFLYGAARKDPSHTRGCANLPSFILVRKNVGSIFFFFLAVGGRPLELLGVVSFYVYLRIIYKMRRDAIAAGVGR